MPMLSEHKRNQDEWVKVTHARFSVTLDKSEKNISTADVQEFERSIRLEWKLEGFALHLTTRRYINDEGCVEIFCQRDGDKESVRLSRPYSLTEFLTAEEKSQMAEAMDVLGVWARAHPNMPDLFSLCTHIAIQAKLAEG